MCNQEPTISSIGPQLPYSTIKCLHHANMTRYECSQCLDEIANGLRASFLDLLRQKGWSEEELVLFSELLDRYSRWGREGLKALMMDAES